MRLFKKYWPSFLRNRKNNRSEKKCFDPALYQSLFTQQSVPKFPLHAIKLCPFLWNNIPDCHKISWGFYFVSIPVF